eukprot:CAMPEP_0194482432 /NCGR_PEP_ID=MMETSP0253-20130528/4388_1 /TAXON_ID=2966 /ORGANISM="Noctiluca scintillans" /LENGTH=112 /DNA_ID=CAMNT_0039321971 /DNA_START=93 /DNA_END=428 /DNA_ORIENTATION=+
MTSAIAAGECEDNDLYDFNLALLSGHVTKKIVPLGFDGPDGHQTVFFFVRPLGMQYSSSAPIVVTDIHPHGHAASLGVQVGWTLASVGGEDVGGRAADDVMRVLYRHTSLLP